MNETERAALVAETLERARRVAAQSSGGAAQSSGGAAQSSGGATQSAEAAKRAEEYEKLKKELEELEETREKKKELSKRKKNNLGQDLVSYEGGFSWCEKCHYVSDIERESELNQRFRFKLKGCQRPSCPGSYQWKKHYGQSPDGDEDFVYEGYKTVKYCQVYGNGTGC